MSSENVRKVQINKKQKSISRAELEQLSKSDLVDRVVQLEAHNNQLRNILQKKLQDEPQQKQQSHTEGVSESTQRKDKKKRKFDFSQAHKRHVLLKLLYFGWDYQGLACQEDTNATIEHHLFHALTRTCLIETRSTSNYHRCGRTDKQVSAFCQVISIDLRSIFSAEEQHSDAALQNEIDYCGLLNRVLPHNIQCIAWMPLRNSLYSARFDCLTRTYRYYFPRGDLHIEAMREACKRLVRHGDFRNFCKMDVNNGVTTFMRDLQHADVLRCDYDSTSSADAGYEMYYLEIRANAFLWHQIRCIMAVLMLIGQRKEEPHIIDDLLNVEANPCKPQYTPASGLPLNLFHCEFRTSAEAERSQQKQESNHDNKESQTQTTNDTTFWIYNESSMDRLIATIQGEWTQYSVKCSMIRDVLQHLEQTRQNQFHNAMSPIRGQITPLQPDGAKTKVYQRLLQRKRCESLENRIDHYVKKQRLLVRDECSEAQATT